MAGYTWVRANLKTASSGRLIATLAVAVVGAFAVGCGSQASNGGAASGSQSSGKAAGAMSLTVGASGIPPVYTNVLSYIADKAGLYKKYGVNVTLRPFESGADAIRAVQSGKLDATRGPSTVVMAAVATGAPLAMFYGMDVNDFEVGSTDPAVRSCEDLKGQQISVDKIGGTRYAALQSILGSCGLSIKDVQPVAFPGSQAQQAMLAGQIKVAVLEVDDVAILQSKGKPPTIIKRLKDVDPVGMYSSYQARRDTLKSKREAFVRFTAALIDATKLFYDQKASDRVAQIATFTGQDVPTARRSLDLYRAIKMFPIDRDGLGRKPMEATLKQQVAAGNIPQDKVPSYDSLVDRSIWKDAMALVKQKGGS